MSGPDLRFLLPINSENAWSDLLATLMAADPVITASVLGLEADAEFTVRREVSRSRSRGSSNRPDLVVQAGGRTVAVIEVKLLADLGDAQLERYYDDVPESDRAACTFVAVSLGRLRLNTMHAAEWQNRTWEEVIAPFAASDDPWVAGTAAAWVEYLDSCVPSVDGATVWNDFDGVDIYLALRVRSAYLHDHVVVPSGSSKRTVEIGSGGLYAAVVDHPIPNSNYVVRWEALGGH